MTHNIPTASTPRLARHPLTALRLPVIALTACAALTLSGCASLSRKDTATVVGATAGAVVGGVMTGTTTGAALGAAAGGLIGNELGKKR